jgi:hypothetical protein
MPTSIHCSLRLSLQDAVFEGDVQSESLRAIRRTGFENTAGTPFVVLHLHLPWAMRQRHGIGQAIFAKLQTPFEVAGVQLQVHDGVGAGNKVDGSRTLVY